MANSDIIDFVIVVEASFRTSGKFQYIVKLIRYLEDLGLKLQIKRGLIPENAYITISLKDKVIPYYSFKHDIDVSNTGHTVLPKSALNFFGSHLFQTKISGFDLFRRDGTTLTTKERILITHAILKEAPFGEYENDYGIEKLIRFQIAKTAYPLHDGDYNKEDEHGGHSRSENDRQMLLKYWANLSMWYKEQPLNLIQKYYGSEVAFYFAWLGFYNKMLIIAALFGLIFSIVSVVRLLVVDQQRVEDICESQIMLCPSDCHSGKYCHFRPMNLSCNYAKISIVFDNRQTVYFAVFMSFWATCFVNLWKRYENTLKIKWNVEFLEMDSKSRVAHKDTCTHKQWSPLTGRLEPYVPRAWKITYVIMSHAVCILILIVIGLTVFAGIMYRVALITAIRLSGSEYLAVHGEFLLPATSAWITVMWVKIFGIFYRQLSEWLTNLENPRTQTEYDHSVINKRAFLAIFNNYSALFYIAFAKSRFYNPAQERSLTRYETDICNPTGCMMSLCIQLCVMIVFQALFSNILTLIIPWIKKKCWARKVETTHLEQWERDFCLLPVDRFFIPSEFLEMVVQYGFVTFFVAAFPLAPLCALANNCIELRLDAYKMVTRYRRPVPRQHSGIRAWNGIIKILTQFSIATNAFVIAFTTDFVSREMYKSDHEGSLDGYIKSTFSIYDMKDFKGSTDVAHNLADNSTLCYYKGLRYPPHHPFKYQLREEYWYQTGMQLLCVIIFEHIIWITNGVLSYFIPNVPEEVRETLHYNRTKELADKYKTVVPVTKRHYHKRTDNMSIRTVSV